MSDPLRSEEQRVRQRHKNLNLLVEAAETLLEKLTEYRLRVWRCRETGECYRESYGWSNKVHRCLDMEKRLSK